MIHHLLALLARVFGWKPRKARKTTKRQRGAPRNVIPFANDNGALAERRRRQGPDPNCDPDCSDRTHCPDAGKVGHDSCGVRACGCPKHHVCEHYIATRRGRA